MHFAPIDSLRRAWRALRGTADPSAATDPAPAGASDLGSMLPLLLGTALLAAAVVLVVLRLTGAAQPHVVVFDIIKYTNAQRAVASKFLGPKGTQEAAPLLLDVGKRTRATIQDVAGPGTLVVIRQAVLQGEGRDITDEVLKKLGLPTDVPTADSAHVAFDVAPTMMGAGPRYWADTPVGGTPATATPNSGLP